MTTKNVVKMVPPQYRKGGSHNPSKGPLNLNKSYNFVDKAEIIDRLRTALDDADITLSVAANKSGVCRQTLRNWFDGKTQRPQVPTLNAVGKLVGLKLKWVYGNE